MKWKSKASESSNWIYSDVRSGWALRGYRGGVLPCAHRWRDSWHLTEWAVPWASPHSHSCSKTAFIKHRTEQSSPLTALVMREIPRTASQWKTFSTCKAEGKQKELLEHDNILETAELNETLRALVISERERGRETDCRGRLRLELCFQSHN